MKEKVDRVNLDEIPFDPIVGFEDLSEDTWRRFEGNSGSDDPYYDSSDSDSISEEKGDLIEKDEVVDPLPRNTSIEIYFDPIA